MAQTNINIRIDETDKKRFDEICSQLGLTMSTAFNIFAKAVIRQRGFPFELSLEHPNAETQAAIEDAINDRDMYGPFDNVESLMEALNA